MFHTHTDLNRGCFVWRRGQTPAKTWAVAHSAGRARVRSPFPVARSSGKRPVEVPAANRSALTIECAFCSERATRANNTELAAGHRHERKSAVERNQTSQRALRRRPPRTLHCAVSGVARPLAGVAVVHGSDRTVHTLGAVVDEWRCTKIS